MFDSFFRLSAKRKDTNAPESREASERAAQKDEAKQAALRQAEALAGDEQAAVGFILACGFADARLMAAEFIQSRQALEQVHAAMRNIDRRVARLVQARLESMRQRERTEQAASACIASARRLAMESALTPSQAADLDREWMSLSGVAPVQQQEFETVRREIAERLAAQTTLQRTVMDALAQLRRIAESPESLAADDLAQTLEDLAARIADCAVSREISSLPRNLLPAFEQEFQRLKLLQQEYEQRRQATSERLQALAGWEAAPAQELDAEQILSRWNAMSRIDGMDMAQLQARFETLLGRLPAREIARQPGAKAPAAQEKSARSSDLLDALEQALQQGSLQQAVELVEKLRVINTGTGPLEAGQAERLSQARSELKRLQDWAKWSGRVSREELIRSVEDLPSLSLALDDLANRVSEARKTWKSLDAASGAASKAQWEQFDAACNRAYEPVAQRGREQAAERERNAQAAQALIAQAREFTGGVNPDDPGSDWKGISAFYRRMRQSWQQLGQMERKERKRLDKEFEQAISVLKQALERQWQAETVRREQLIEEALTLDPAGRGTVDAVRRLQEQWQESARSLPLGSNEEQKLWKRFRQACDGLFAKRKEAADSAGEARRRNLLAREAVCARLEAALDVEVEAVPGLLAEASAEWGRIGPEPNDDQGAVQKRFRKAVAALQGRMDSAKAEARLASHRTLMEKLALCRMAESAVVGKSKPDLAGWKVHWQVLPQLDSRQENLLRARFDSAIAAMEAADTLYSAMLEANRAQLLEELLRLEILFGLDSPADFAQERRRIQMEVLQDSLAGNREPAGKERLFILCTLPATTDEHAAERIDQILRAGGGFG